MSGKTFNYYKKQSKIMSLDIVSLREEVKELQNVIELTKAQTGIEPHFIIEDADENN